MNPRLALFAPALLCAMAAAQTTAADRSLPEIDPRGCPGALVIGGGGALPDEIYDRFIELSGGERANVVLVPTASSRADSPAERSKLLARWEQAHPKARFSTLHTRDRAEADSAAFCAPLRRATAIWFGGGSQQRIADAYVGTRVEREVYALVERGGTVGGSSAGAAIQSRTMIAGGKSPPQLSTGLALLPRAIVDQHFLKRRRMPRLIEALERTPGHFGLGVDEGTAVFIRGRDLRVFGRSEALLLLAESSGKAQRVVRLRAGGRADLISWQRAARQRAAGIWPPERMQTPLVASGTVMLGGGGRLPKATFERFIALAGGKEQARIVVAPTAMPRDPGAGQDRTAVLLRRMGAQDVTVIDARHPSEVTEADVELLERATGVWFGGGRQWRTVDAFDGTPVVAAFHRVLQRGGVIGGSSAGATIQGEFLVRGNPLGNADMWCEGYDRGFAFLPGCAVDQHFLARRRLKDLQAVIDQCPQIIGIGVDEGTCAIVTGSRLEVQGASKVCIIDARGKAVKEAQPTWLEPGDSWDLVSGRPLPK